MPRRPTGIDVARTGRLDPARRLTEANRKASTEYGSNQDVARCDLLLARLDLAAGDPTSADQRLTSAAATSRDGDYLVELAEALTITGPRGRPVTCGVGWGWQASNLRPSDYESVSSCLSGIRA